MKKDKEKLPPCNCKAKEEGWDRHADWCQYLTALWKGREGEI